MKCPEGCDLTPWTPCEHGYRYVVWDPSAVYSVNSSPAGEETP